MPSRCTCRRFHRIGTSQDNGCGETKRDEATPKVNGGARPRDKFFAVRADDRLTFDYMKVGARIYIAVAGGIDVPPILGSRSTYALGALGGFFGRKLAAGDVLPGHGEVQRESQPRSRRETSPIYPKSLELRV